MFVFLCCLLCVVREQVVGEIYDEDDEEEEVVDSTEISRRADGSFLMKGYAELDDVSEALELELDEEDLNDCSTIGGLLIARAGKIPNEGDRIQLAGFEFVVSEVEDNRRIVGVSARKISAARSNSKAASTATADDDGKVKTSGSKDRDGSGVSAGAYGPGGASGEDLKFSFGGGPATDHVDVLAAGGPIPTEGQQLTPISDEGKGGPEELRFRDGEWIARG